MKKNHEVKIELTYSGGKLWWSADGRVNWGIVGPKSPYTIVRRETDVDWVGDETIEELIITPKEGDIMDDLDGHKRGKKAKIKKCCNHGDKCKYDITVIVAGSQETFTVDPDMEVCDKEEEECPGPDAAV